MCLDRRLKNRPFSGMESTMFTFASRTFVIAMAAALIGRSLTASDVVDKFDDALLGSSRANGAPPQAFSTENPSPPPQRIDGGLRRSNDVHTIWGQVAGRLDIKHLVTNGELGHID